jgi:hypothetical protein
MAWKQNSKIKIVGLISIVSVWLVSCATTADVAGRDEIKAAPGVSTARLLKTAAAAGGQMNYSVKQEGNLLIMERSLPFGAGYFIPNPAKHRNRITVTAVPGAAGDSPEVRVVGEYLGDLRDRDVHNCVPCDVNQIKKAIREAR